MIGETKSSANSLGNTQALAAAFMAPSSAAGTGRYAGITGAYDFSWRVLVETEDGVVQGQSMDLKGRFRIVPSPGAATSEPAAGGSQ
jgi:hypothetical protein